MDKKDMFDRKEITPANTPVVDATYAAVKALYEHILTLPGGRERDEAVLKLEETLFWLVKSIEGNNASVKS